jgi:hypothetical protein
MFQSGAPIIGGILEVASVLDSLEILKISAAQARDDVQ